MKKKFKNPIPGVLLYGFLILWATTTVYPINRVRQHSSKTKDKILRNSFDLPIGELFTTAN